jgi:hypothetical protein
MAHLKIGELAEQGQVNLQTIRYYEREGLLPKPPAWLRAIGFSRPMRCAECGSSSERRSLDFP